MLICVRTASNVCAIPMPCQKLHGGQGSARNGSGARSCELEFEEHHGIRHVWKIN